MSIGTQQGACERAHNVMTFQNVIDLYCELDAAGIPVWVDGGWGVDALLNRQLRPHADLDIAIEWKDVPRLRDLLERRGYAQIRDEGWANFVLADVDGHEIDVHAFVSDDRGEVVAGIVYPSGSLTGTGKIAGQAVRCISPEHMVAFLAPWIGKWPEKYITAVRELCREFDIEIPKELTEAEQARR